LIGVFDSGIGGLTVLKEIDKQLDNQSFIYLADTAFAPYGDKSATEIIQRCDHITNYLIQQGAQLIVVACNTATAIAVDELRKKYLQPIVAMEPAVKPAVKISTEGAVGIMATTRTLSSQRYANLLEKFAESTTVYEQACSGLVEQIENIELETPKTKKLLTQYLQPLIDKNIDTLVLGCTHYPFLKSQIQNIIGQKIKIIDTAEAVTQQVIRKLEIKYPDNEKTIRFITTGNLQKFNRQLINYWPYPIPEKYVESKIV